METIKTNKIINNKWTALLILLSVGMLVNIPFPFSNSGVIAVYGTDIFSLLFVPYLLHDYLKNRRNYEKESKVALVTAVSFLVYMTLVSGFRFISGNYDFKSLLIPRVFISSSWIYLLILRGKITKQNLLLALRIFAIVLSTLSIVLFFTTAPIAYRVFQSPAIRTTMIIMMYPLVMFDLITSKRFKYSIGIYLVALILTAGMVITGVSSGSRINSLLVPLNIITVSIVYFGKSKRNFSSLALGTLLGIVFIILVFPYSYRYRVGSGRSKIFQPIIERVIEPLYKNVEMVDLFGEPRNGNLDGLGGSNSSSDGISNNSASITNPNNVPPRDDGETSMEDSSSARREAWKMSIEDIKTNILFGPGLKYYEVTYSTGSTHLIPSHNFVLEYTLGFGLIGLILFLAAVISPMVVLFNSKMNEKNFPINLITFILVMATIGSNILYQPLLLNPPITLFIYLVTGLMVSRDKEERIT